MLFGKHNLKCKAIIRGLFLAIRYAPYLSLKQTRLERLVIHLHAKLDFGLLNLALSSPYTFFDRIRSNPE